MNARRFTTSAALVLSLSAAPAIADEWYMPRVGRDCGTVKNGPLDTMKTLRALGVPFTVEDSGGAKPAMVTITSAYFKENGMPSDTVIFFRSRAQCIAARSAAIDAGEHTEAAGRAARRAAEAEETEKYK